MPTGAVRWFDAEKGYGFLSTDDGEDVFVHIKALPPGTTELRQGTRVDFSVAQGRKGKQALSVTIQDVPQSVVKAKRRPPVELAGMVDDLIKTLDGLTERLRDGHYPPDNASRQIAVLLRRISDDLDV